MVGPSGLTAKVLDAFRAPPGRLVVALSGGPDSAVCAWAAVSRSLPVRAVHVHHGLEASDTLAVAGAAVAAQLRIPLRVLSVMVPKAASPEGQARLVRYRALVADLEPDETLITGHTRDDQAESVLAALIRGAGVDGLAGMRWITDRVARPLLGVDRASTRSLASQLGLPWMEDPVNLDPGLQRNRLRSLLAALEEQRPGAAAAVARTARNLAAEADLLDDLAGSSRLEMRGGERGEGLDVRVLLSDVADPLGTRVLRRALRLARPPYAGTSAEIERLHTLGRVSGPPVVQLGGGLVGWWEGVWLYLTHRPSRPAEVAWDGTRPLTFGDFEFASGYPTPLPSPWRIDVPAQPMKVRCLEPGDRIALHTGHKRVVEALAEAGIAVTRRNTWPVVVQTGRVIWVPGVRRSGAEFGRIGAVRYLSLTASEKPWKSAP